MACNKSSKTGEWIILVIPKNPMEAEIIKGKLESEGIPVFLKKEAIGRIYGISMDGLGEIKVLVPENLVEKARGIL
ncbi:MAG: hypothetical protein COZ37_07140 [bacterium (Candidatus Ratteibacteria) CG_4_10_14_3_um_filter_41_18]|uniref:DUF2007 domain-containing protein n=4 Tax=Candidatus Ratteibacteria TaxID=2979319 RepID=A0A2M7EAM7_9BACT|nr:MAG: hypothetical protein COS11_00385 [bacterium (Candidatus Ratteibacteria) CG01_land_8_20_14_3_00_40_19]PIW33872.1 MAG: hypothetical protein COW28_02265 [bacterium (Candidatus Ratteibacteria) CG15_BIG_FIL_POST_REV_8_21_14_020_41_12]PIX76578.1 MAG: hypothetical protein COZ37_07140 [bacterium (Candidatus Ratteibacteria) CG_4_10_14_3_um_filter_41_18]PJA61991.1 MAG: hypothetical protein CO162_03410 [bacterium (Candidatus Ratteibacteria) CG_4_9_14_3_um_filter_41_21]HCG76652.1 hypothetical prote